MLKKKWFPAVLGIFKAEAQAHEADAEVGAAPPPLLAAVSALMFNQLRGLLTTSVESCVALQKNIYIYIHKEIHIHVYISISICMHMYIYICIYTYDYTYLYLYTYMYMYICMYIYTHTNIEEHIYTYTNK